MDCDFFESEDDVLLKFCDSSDSSDDDDSYDMYRRCYLITSLPLLLTAISLAAYTVNLKLVSPHLLYHANRHHYFSHLNGQTRGAN